MSKKGPTPIPPTQRFWPKVASGDTDCWVWTGTINETGYGRFYVGPGLYAKAHRWAYEYLIADIPEGLQLDHLCRNRACVNPWHLEPVTPLVNTQRGQNHNSLKTSCPQGHPYTEENTYRNTKGRSCKTCHLGHPPRRYPSADGSAPPAPGHRAPTSNPGKSMFGN